MRNIALTLLLVALLGGLVEAKAELWRCGDDWYSTQQVEGKNCIPLKTSLSCGQDGNRYITPFREGMQETVSSNCGRGLESTSPIVNMAFVESYRETPYRAERPKKPEATEISAFSPEGLLPKVDSRGSAKQKLDVSELMQNLLDASSALGE